MKLIVAIIQADDAPGVLRELSQHGLRATRIKTAGGFLLESNATLLIGVENRRVDEALAVLRDACITRRQVVTPALAAIEPGEFYLPTPLEVEVGGATIFVLNVERAERL